MGQCSTTGGCCWASSQSLAARVDSASVKIRVAVFKSVCSETAVHSTYTKHKNNNNENTIRQQWFSGDIFTELSTLQTLSSSSWLANERCGRRNRPSLYFWVTNSRLCSGEASQSSSSATDIRAAQKSLALSLPIMMKSWKRKQFGIHFQFKPQICQIVLKSFTPRSKQGCLLCSLLIDLTHSPAQLMSNSAKVKSKLS